MKKVPASEVTRKRVEEVFSGEQIGKCHRAGDGIGLQSALIRYVASDVDFGTRVRTIAHGRDPDRTTVLPEQLHSPLQQHLLRVAALHKDDLSKGGGLVPLPCAIARKYPSASTSFSWQFAFLSGVSRPWGDNGRQARWHTSDSSVQRPFRRALQLAGIHKHASVHTLRHYSEFRTMPTDAAHTHVNGRPAGFLGWMRAGCSA